MRILKRFALLFSFCWVLFVSCDYHSDKPIDERSYADFIIRLDALENGYADLEENQFNYRYSELYKFSGIKKNLPVAVRPHYNFSGWAVVKDSVVDSDNLIMSIDEDPLEKDCRYDQTDKAYIIDLVAVYDPVVYNIRYEVGKDGCTLPDTAIKTFTYDFLKENKTLEFPKPVDLDPSPSSYWNGWKFMDWYIYNCSDLKNVLDNHPDFFTEVFIVGTWNDYYDYTVTMHFEDPENLGNYLAAPPFIMSNVGSVLNIDTSFYSIPGYNLITEGSFEINSEGSTIIDLYYDLVNVKYYFDACGGKFDDNKPVKVITGKFKTKMTNDDFASISNVSKPGYKFCGWKAGNDIVTFESPQMIFDSDQDFEAVWIAD